MERSSATARSSSTVPENDDLLPDVDHLVGDITNGAPASSSTAPYISFSSLLGIASGLLLLSINMDMMFICYVPNCMVSYITLLLDEIVIYAMIIMFHLPL